MAFVPTLIAAAGTAVSAIGAYGEGQAAKARAEHQAGMADYNARVNEMNARAAEEKAKFDQIRFRERAGQIMGKTRAKLGASGALMSEGAPLALLGQQASNLALDSSLIGHEGMTRAGRFRSGAALDRAQAKMFEDAGRRAERASYWNIGSSLLSGFGGMNASGMFGDTFMPSTPTPRTPMTSTFRGATPP